MSPPSIGTNCTRSTRIWIIRIAGIGVRGDCQAGGATGVEGGVLITGHQLTVLIVGSTLPGMLLLVQCECICFVFFNHLGVIGFGVVIIAGASVILVRCVYPPFVVQFVQCHLPPFVPSFVLVGECMASIVNSHEGATICE
jgi:hypothetical protein